MAGKYNRAAALLQRDFPRATYFHCAAHILNLCIVEACKIPSVRNMMGVPEQVCFFFMFFPKCHKELAAHICSLHEGVTNHKKLINKTRWIARIESLETLILLAPAVAETFQVIANDGTWNSDSTTKAAYLML